MKFFSFFLLSFQLTLNLFSQSLTQTKTCTRTAATTPEKWTTTLWQNVTFNDNKYVKTANLRMGTSHPITFTGFGFTIPSAATISKIDVRIIRSKTGPNNIRDFYCALATGTDASNYGGAFPNMAKPSYWTKVETPVLYSNTAGGTGTNGQPYQWTPEMINASYFGVFFDISFFAGGAGAAAQIEQVEVTVYYALSTPRAVNTVDYAGLNATDPPVNLNHNFYPNPTRQKATIAFRAIETGKTTIDIYDFQSVKLKSMLLGNSIKNKEYQYEINLSGLKPGIYLYQLQNGDGIGKGSIIKTE